MEQTLSLPWRAHAFEQGGIGVLGRPGICYFIYDSLGCVVAVFGDLEKAQRVVEIVNAHHRKVKEAP